MILKVRGVKSGGELREEKKKDVKRRGASLLRAAGGRWKKRREERRPGAEMAVVVVVVRRSTANGSVPTNQPTNQAIVAAGARTHTGAEGDDDPELAAIDRGDCAGAAVCRHWLSPGA